jgi:anti-sigma regulatory factor (Ser/Thr protein kinase)
LGIRGWRVGSAGGEITTRIDIASEADVHTACQEARALAQRLGFTGAEVAHLVTATAEIAGNVWRHAGGGRVQLDQVEELVRVGIAVTATDEGPGIPDVEAAMREGWSSVGSMGLGLPGARRLMDEFRVASRPAGGTTVTMTRWRQKAGPEPGLPLVDWAAAPAVAPVGRQALVSHFRGGVLLAVVAGLGGEPEADMAADVAGSILERHASESPIALVERCHAALGAGRGVAIGLASLSGLASRVTWLALGGVGVALMRAGAAGPALTLAPTIRGGAGGRLPTLRAATVTVAPRDTFVLAADRQLPDEGSRGEVAHATPRQVAERLLEDPGRGGLVLVARRR